MEVFKRPYTLQAISFQFFNITRHINNMSVMFVRLKSGHWHEVKQHKLICRVNC